MKRYKIVKVGIMQGDIDTLEEALLWLINLQPSIQDKKESDLLFNTRKNIVAIIRDFTEEFNNEI